MTAARTQMEGKPQAAYRGWDRPEKEQAMKDREHQAERKCDTRRKILAGAMVLDRLARGEGPE